MSVRPSKFRLFAQLKLAHVSNWRPSVYISEIHLLSTVTSLQQYRLLLSVVLGVQVFILYVYKVIVIWGLMDFQNFQNFRGHSDIKGL